MPVVRGFGPRYPVPMACRIDNISNRSDKPRILFPATDARECVSARKPSPTSRTTRTGSSMGAALCSRLDPAARNSEVPLRPDGRFWLRPTSRRIGWNDIACRGPSDGIKSPAPDGAVRWLGCERCSYRVKTPQRRRSKVPLSGGCEFVPVAFPKNESSTESHPIFFAKGGSSRMIKLSVFQLRYCSPVADLGKGRRRGGNRGYLASSRDPL